MISALRRSAGWAPVRLPIMSQFGTYFRVSTFGESHCEAVGCIVDGMPPGMALDTPDIQRQLSRRRPGQSALTLSLIHI